MFWSVSWLQTPLRETLTSGPKPREILFFRPWCTAGPWPQALLMRGSWEPAARLPEFEPGSAFY